VVKERLVFVKLEFLFEWNEQEVKKYLLSIRELRL
jgi:hypothetical protein